MTQTTRADAERLLAELAGRGIGLLAEPAATAPGGSRLALDDPHGRLTAADLEALRRLRNDLVALLDPWARLESWPSGCARHPERPVERFDAAGVPLCAACAAADLPPPWWATHR